MRRGNLDSFGPALAGGRLPRRCAARNDSVKCDKCSRNRRGLATRRPGDFGANAPAALTPGHLGSSRIALEAPAARWEDGLPGSRPIGQRHMCRPACVGTRTPTEPRRQQQQTPHLFDPWSRRRDRPIKPQRCGWHARRSSSLIPPARRHFAEAKIAPVRRPWHTRAPEPRDRRTSAYSGNWSLSASSEKPVAAFDATSPIGAEGHTRGIAATMFAPPATVSRRRSIAVRNAPLPATSRS